MHIKQLRYFIAVAEHLNFTEAARSLYVSQPALSQQIADLEKQLNVKLFARNHHSVSLTPAGVIFLQEAYDIVAKSEQATQKVQIKDSSSITGTITIGYLGQYEKKIIPDLVRILRQKCPLMNIKLSYVAIGKLYHGLENDEIDIGFCLSFGSQQLNGLFYETLYTSGLSVLMRDDHPLAKKSTLKLKDIMHEPIITIKRGDCFDAFKQMTELFKHEKYTPNIVNEDIDYIDSLFLMVKAGQGISILSSHVDISAYPALRFVPIADKSAKTDLIIAWKKNNTNPLIPLFLDELRAITKAYDH